LAIAGVITNIGLSYFSSKACFFLALSSSVSASSVVEDSPFPLFLLGAEAEMQSGLKDSDLSFFKFLV